MANGELSKEHLAELYKPLELQYQQLDNSIPELQGEVDFRRIQLVSSEVVILEAKELYEEWHTMEYEQKRAIVETITEHIIIGKDDITIALCYLPSLQIAEKADVNGRGIRHELLLTPRGLAQVGGYDKFTKKLER